MPRSGQEPSRRRLRVMLAVMSLVVSMLAVAAPGAAADGPGSERAQERRAQVLDYWTPQRVRSAIPRLPVVDGTPTHHRPDHAGGPGGGGDDGGGGGGGGGGTTTVTGAPWTGGSLTGQVGETTGKVLFTMGGNNYVCSGSTVASPAGQSIVLTAGHCVHDGDGQETSWASMWMFVPAYEDARTFSCDVTAYGCWTASTLTTTGDWYTRGAFADDAGFAVMDPGGHSGADNLVDVVGAQSIAFDSVVGEATHAFGYPAAQKYKGDDLIYCAGTAVDGVQNGTAGLGCDMTGGSSGGPWYAPFSADSETGTAVSVNSHIYRSVKNVMFGPVFDADEKAAYDQATGTSTGAPSNN